MTLGSGVKGAEAQDITSSEILFLLLSVWQACHHIELYSPKSPRLHRCCMSGKFCRYRGRCFIFSLMCQVQISQVELSLDQEGLHFLAEGTTLSWMKHPKQLSGLTGTSAPIYDLNIPYIPSSMTIDCLMRPWGAAPSECKNKKCRNTDMYWWNPRVQTLTERVWQFVQVYPKCTKTWRHKQHLAILST